MPCSTFRCDAFMRSKTCSPAWTVKQALCAYARWQAWRHGPARAAANPKPHVLGRLAAHAPGGPLQRFMGEVFEECQTSPPLVGLLSARLCALWVAHPETARLYLDTWERPAAIRRPLRRHRGRHLGGLLPLLISKSCCRFA